MAKNVITDKITTDTNYVFALIKLGDNHSIMKTVLNTTGCHCDEYVLLLFIVHDIIIVGICAKL